MGAHGLRSEVSEAASRAGWPVLTNPPLSFGLPLAVLRSLSAGLMLPGTRPKMRP